MSSGVPDDEALERVDRFRDEVRDLNERWENRISFKGVVPWPELYLNSRAEIALYGHWRVELEDCLWLCRIARSYEALEAISSGGKVAPDRTNRDGGDDQIVLVEVAEFVEGPKMFVRSVCRPYLFKNQFCSTRKGLLYQRQSGGGFEVFPLGRNGEVTSVRCVAGKAPNEAARKVVQCGPTIVDRVSDHDCERFWNWLFGPVGHLSNGRLALDGGGAHFNDCKLVQLSREQGVGKKPQLINVAVGPLNL